MLMLNSKKLIRYHKIAIVWLLTCQSLGAENVITIRSNSQQVIEGIHKNASFLIELSRPAEQEISVQVLTCKNTSYPNEDYHPLRNYELRFLPGEERKRLSVEIVDDLLEELDKESFLVELKHSTNAMISPVQRYAKCVIRDNDGHYARYARSLFGAYGLNALPEVDSDADGFTNFDEFVFGSNPLSRWRKRNEIVKFVRDGRERGFYYFFLRRAGGIEEPDGYLVNGIKYRVVDVLGDDVSVSRLDPKTTAAPPPPSGYEWAAYHSEDLSDVDSMLLRVAAEKKMSTNLVRNHSFDAFEPASGVLVDWVLPQNIKSNLNVKTDDKESGLLVSGNASVPRYVWQEINVKSNSSYKVSAELTFAVNDYYHAGVWVTDNDGATIGHRFVRASKGNSVLSFIVNSGESGSIFVNAGFPLRINGFARFKFIEIKEVAYDSLEFESALGNYLVDLLALKFDEQSFDDSVAALCRYVNSLLLADNRNDDEARRERTHLVQVAQAAGFTKLRQYMSQSRDLVRGAYCVKSSLCLTALLEQCYHIPVRQVHMTPHGERMGIHQFIDYWNPFRFKWVSIDPYYSMIYESDDRLLHSAEVDNLIDLPPSFSYRALNGLSDLQTSTDLIKLWEETTVGNTGSLMRTFPY